MHVSFIAYKGKSTLKSTSNLQAKHFLKLLFNSCYKNPKLKASLIADPISTLEKITGKPNKLPNGYCVKVEDQSNPECIYINIPPKPKTKSNS